MNLEQSLTQHYAHGSLQHAIFNALLAAGKDVSRLELADLAPVDEFHIGSRRATIDFAEQFGVQRGMHLLDIGCGLGGASRYFAHDHGCRVTGIDLTEEYVQVAGALARMLGLGELVSYKVGSALSLAFSSGTFDGAYMLHVGMNVEDKAKLFAEVLRVLKPKGLFGIYDVMRDADGELSYPVPWATTPQMSFVMTAANYRHLLGAAGFEVMNERSRREFAIEFFRELRAQVAQTAVMRGRGTCLQTSGFRSWTVP
jgi:ubiquinone/menaquinone biosynthesis C-methylase UbiE